jgi:hypothetical protein
MLLLRDEELPSEELSIVIRALVLVYFPSCVFKRASVSICMCVCVCVCLYMSLALFTYVHVSLKFAARLTQTHTKVYYVHTCIYANNVPMIMCT